MPRPTPCLDPSPCTCASSTRYDTTEDGIEACIRQRGANVPRVKQDARLFSYLLIAALAVYALGRYEARQAADLGWHERNVAKVTAQVRVERAKLAPAMAAKDTTARAVTGASDNVDAAQDSLADVLESARLALIDSAATIETLRRELGRTASAAHGLSLQVDALQAGIILDAQAHLAERAAFTAVIAAQDAVIAAQKKQIKALDCRILGMRCPSRLQSAVGGAGAIVLLLLIP